MSKLHKCKACKRKIEKKYLYCGLECAAYCGALKKPDNSPLKVAILNAVFDEKLKAYQPLTKDDVLIESRKDKNVSAT